MRTKARRVTDKEVKQIQLEMLDEIDAFCRQNNIRYSLAFGTLLGAVRHKGYIPWDDDVDIIMPLPDMLRFKKIFQSDKLQYCDIDTTLHYEYHFSRICYKQTFSKRGWASKSYGINIDLYPVVGLPSSIEEVDAFFKSIESKYRHYYDKRLLWKKRIEKRFPNVLLPDFNGSLRELRQILLFSYPYDNALLYLHAGRMNQENVFDFDVFENLIEAPFENHRYLIPLDFDKYLSHCYGNYMDLPPIEKRIPYHGGEYYWKIK